VPEASLVLSLKMALQPPQTKLPLRPRVGQIKRSAQSGLLVEQCFFHHNACREATYGNTLLPVAIAVPLFVRQMVRSRWNKGLKSSMVPRSAGSYVDVSMDISERPERRMVRELSRYEDPDYPVRPPAPMRPRAGLWAPPGPEAIAAPEMLVVGLGRQLRTSDSSGPRARLGAGAVEALQQRYGVKTYFDADSRAYTGTCKASLDKTGQAGVQKVTLLQPLVDYDHDVGSSIYSTMQRPGMDKAMVLFVFSDHQLPFGQLRMRSSFDDQDPRMWSATAALEPGNRITCLHVGAGRGDASEPLLEAEVGVLPRTLANAATAIELWLSEADLGLVMRFINRPEMYEMPPGWPHQRMLSNKDGADVAAPSIGLDERTMIGENSGDTKLDSYNVGSLIGPSDGDNFRLFDLNRDDPTEVALTQLTPMSPQTAALTVKERPPQCEALLVAGRRFDSSARLQKDVVQMIFGYELGMHIRLQDDEDVVRALLSFHPNSDQLLDDLVEVKVDCSPVDDNVRCLWAVKFDGHEQDVSLKACLEGLEQWLQLNPQVGQGSSIALRKRLGLGRWSDAVRETPYERAMLQERLIRQTHKEDSARW